MKTDIKAIVFVEMCIPCTCFNSKVYLPVHAHKQTLLLFSSLVSYLVFIFEV